MTGPFNSRRRAEESYFPRMIASWALVAASHSLNTNSMPGKFVSETEAHAILVKDPNLCTAMHVLHM
jgi:hypothetical protein